MTPKQIIRLSTILLAAMLGVIGTSFGFGMGWLIFSMPGVPELRVPGTASVVTPADEEPIKTTLTKGNGTPSTIPGSWSRFRGDDFDAIYKEDIRLKRSLTEDHLPVLWGVSLGEGFAGAAVKNGCVYILDYDMEAKRDALRCLSFDDGEEIWRYSYNVKIKKNHGMSRSIPAVTEKYCVTVGPKCHAACVDAMTGEEKWFINLKTVYGAVEPEWYAAQCPLIVDDTAILAPAGPEVLMVAIDCETGEERWRTPNPFGWTMTHVSIMPMELNGRTTYVYCGKDGVVSVLAANGDILWSTPDWRIVMATCPSPVVLPDNRIFFCGGYTAGSLMLQIQDGGIPKTLVHLPETIFGSEQQTPIFFDGHLFGIDRLRKQFVCLNLDGKVVWHSGSDRFGSGPYILADNMFLLLDDDGKLTACEATMKGYRPVFEAQVLDDHGCWAPLAMVAGRLLLRDLVYMKCLDLRE